MKKLSYRERILVLVLIIVMILFSGIFLFIVPVFKDIEKEKNNYNQVYKKWKETENIIIQKDKVKNDTDKKYDEARKISQWFIDDKQTYSVDKFLQEYFDKNGIFIKSLKVSGVSFITYEEYECESESIVEYDSTESNENLSGASAEVCIVEIDYEASRTSFFNFLQSIKDSQKAIEVNKFDIISYTENYSGSMQINAYYAEPSAYLNTE